MQLKDGRSGSKAQMPIVVRCLATARLMRPLPAMSSVENRYAEARPNAAAMIAADWSGGAIKTSFRVRSRRVFARQVRRADAGWFANWDSLSSGFGIAASL